MHHVIWDWNGTLFDDLDLIVEAVNAAIHPFGKPPIDHATYATHYTRPVSLFYEALLGRTVGPSEMERIDELFHEAYFEWYDRASLAEDAEAAIARAADAGATQSIASMLRHDRLVTAVRDEGVDTAMLAVDGHRGTAGETKAQHLSHHVDQLRSLYPLDGRRMVLIGDITDDADAAAAVGIECVLVDAGSQEREALVGTGVAVAAGLLHALELAGITTTGVSTTGLGER